MSARFAKQAAANLVTVGVNASFAILSTLLLTRRFDHSEFSLWVFVVGVAGYIGLVEGGLFGAVVRRVAASSERGDAQLRSVRAALLLLSGFAIAAGGLVLLVAHPESWLFSSAPEVLRGEAAAALAIVALASVLALPSAAFRGFFAGAGRAWTPAWINLIVKSAAIATLFLSRSHLSLRGAAAIVAGGTISAAALISAAAIRELGPRVLSVWKAARSDLVELRGDTATFLWWSIAMLLISGLDGLVVSRFDFERVGAYGLAAQFVALLIAAFSASVSPLLPAATARAFVYDTQERTARTLVDGTRLSIGSLTAAGGVLWVGGPSVMRLFYGDALAAEATGLLRLLVVGVIVRQIPAVLGLLQVANGDHRSVRVAPLTEGLSNVVASIGLAAVFGATGVALGTVVGGIVAVATHARCTFGSAKALEVTPRVWLRSAWSGAWAPGATACATAVASDHYPVLVPFALVAVVGVWWSRLLPNERRSVVALCARPTGAIAHTRVGGLRYPATTNEQLTSKSAS